MRRGNTHSIRNQMAIEVIGFFSSGSKICAHQVSWYPLSIGEASRLKVIFLFLLPHDLRFGAKLKLIVLREILDHTLLLV